MLLCGVCGGTLETLVGYGLAVAWILIPPVTYLIAKIHRWFKPGIVAEGHFGSGRVRDE